MQLENLSVELVQLIFSFLQPREKHALLFSCKFLNGLVLPLIYEDIGFHLPYSTPERPQPLLLLQNLLRHPERGSLVKHIRFPPKSTWIAKSLEHGEMETLAQRGGQVIDMAFEDMFAKFRRNSTGSPILFVILLSFCPNLESFAICDDLPDEADYFYRVVEGENGRSRIYYTQEDTSALFPFRNVSSVEYSRVMALPWGVNKLFSLARLKDLKLDICQGAMPPPPSCPALARLVLRNVYLREDCVGLFLDAAPNLKYLRLELVRKAGLHHNQLGPFASSGGAFIDCSALKTNIANTIAANYSESTAYIDPFQFQAPEIPRCKLLESLTITTGFVADAAVELSNGGGFKDGLYPEIDRPISWGIKGSLGSLKELEVLKTLEVPLPVLLGWHVNRAMPLADHLPDSLVELTFRADLSHWGLFEWDAEAVKQLVEVYAEGENRGNLKVLKYVLLEESIRDYEDLLKEMHGILDKVGIRFEAVEVPDPE